MQMAVGAVVNAAWDLAAGRAGLPVWEFLAGLTPKELVSLVDFRHLSDALTPDEALAILRAAEPGRTARTARLKAEGYPADQRWDVAEAVRWMTALAPYTQHWIEEPTSADDALGHVAVRSGQPVKVATGEHIANRVVFKQLLQAGVVDFVQIDAVRVAGGNENLAILLLAAKYGVPVCPHAGVGLCELAHEGRPPAAGPCWSAPPSTICCRSARAVAPRWSSAGSTTPGCWPTRRPARPTTMRPRRPGCSTGRVNSPPNATSSEYLSRRSRSASRTGTRPSPPRSSALPHRRR